MHEIRTNEFGPAGHYAFCRYSCGWTGPFRRWEFLARRDGRKHLAGIRP